MPPGTIYGASPVSGSQEVQGGESELTVTCPTGKQVVSGDAWLSWPDGDSSALAFEPASSWSPSATIVLRGGAQAGPVASSNADWSSWSAQATIAWTMICAEVVGVGGA